MAAPKNRERVAKNFIRTHGRVAFRKLVEALATGESGQTIAQELGVSRERIRQWKNAFGEMYMVYQLHPEVERLLGNRKLPTRGREPAISLEFEAVEESTGLPEESQDDLDDDILLDEETEEQPLHSAPRTHSKPE